MTQTKGADHSLSAPFRFRGDLVRECFTTAKIRNPGDHHIEGRQSFVLVGYAPRLVAAYRSLGSAGWIACVQYLFDSVRPTPTLIKCKLPPHDTAEL
jgi:hypothetical protein